MSRLTIRNGRRTALFDAGGGIALLGNLELFDVEIRDNTTGDCNGCSIALTNTTISGNSARFGGGIFTQGPLIIRNSTISGNTASMDGGGLHFNSGTPTDFAALTNVTITGNRADPDGLNGGAGGGVREQADEPVRLFNTILAGNTVGQFGSASDCSGRVSVLGPSLIEHTFGCDITGSPLVGVSPQLGPLGNHGGFTPTHPLLPGSPAIDAGDPATCLALDQRGFPRFDGNNNGTARCDLGAFERFEFAGTMALTPGQQSLHAGDPFSLDLAVGNPLGPTTPVDVFVVVLPPASLGPALGCPGADPLVFLTDGGHGLQVTCLSAPPEAFQAFALATAVPRALPPTVLPGFVTAVMPAGTAGRFTVVVALTPPGAFLDGKVDGADLLAVGTAALDVVP
jgi:hypothetical protein